MMTDQEIIDVVKAHQEGKTIQQKSNDGTYHDIWHDINHGEPGWNFNKSDYRVKPKPHYRPYNGQKEIVNDMVRHQGILKAKGYDDYYVISIIANISICISVAVNGDDTAKQEFVSYKSLLENFTWSDGSPCGIIEY